MNLDDDENPFADDNIEMMEDDLPSSLQNQTANDGNSAL